MNEILPTLKDVRSYWDARPCNVKHSNSVIGTLDYYNEVERRKYFVEPHIPAFASFESWHGKKVLEIGCGIGTDAINFARAGADYTGVELSGESLRLAQARFEIFNLPSRLIEADVETIDKHFLNESFDLIYSFGVLHHTLDLQKSLIAIRNISDAKTRIKIMVYARDSWKNAMIQSNLDQPEAQSGCPIARTYSKQEITEELNLAGFKVLEISQDHIFPYVVEKYRKYEYQKEEWFRVMPEEYFRALEKMLGWHLMIDAELMN
jgi:SAM-dependent methyltransferase